MLTYSDLICEMMVEYGFTKIERDPKDYLFFSSSSKTLIIYIAQKKVTEEDVLKHARILELLDGQKYIVCLRDYTMDACKTAQKYKQRPSNCRWNNPIRYKNHIKPSNNPCHPNRKKFKHHIAKVSKIKSL
ncbi:MAG: hypothetical protein QXQ25_06955, partial [Thermoplasmata archaeon]